MSTERLIPLVLGETADEEVEIACAPGLLEYLMSPAPGDVQSLGEVVKNYQPTRKPNRRELDSDAARNSWLAQILLD
jgi:hypothetical protein